MFFNKLRVAGTKKELTTYYNALKPDEEERERASYTVKLARKLAGGSELIIVVKAKDFVAYRATMTSVLNVMAIVDKTIKTAR